MSAEDRERWNIKYADGALLRERAPDSWLLEQIADLPPGRALELACGLGHNSIALAQRGWQVDAIDVSEVGLNIAAELASAANVAVNWILADLDHFSPTESYDLIFVFRFLDRRNMPKIVERSLLPGGRLIHETFTLSHTLRPQSRMKNPAFALAPAELPTLYPCCAPVSYEECSLPDRDVARFVGVGSRVP